MKNVYLIGIGGIGMSAIARYYRFKGMNVSGYDRTPSELTAQLEGEGIAVHYEDRPDLMPEDVSETLVVYTPAVPSDLGEMRKALSAGYRTVKRSMILGEITRGKRCMAVAGTHGKTTTSTLVAHILTESGTGCSAFLGGISKNYGTNLLVSDSPVVVAEADEFDRSFLQLHPDIAAITAMDADHLDIYGTVENMREAFYEFASQTGGTIILKYGLELPDTITAKIHTYHFDDESADFHGRNFRLDGSGHYTFDLKYPGGVLSDIRVGTLGRLNVENSIAAAAMCLCAGIDAQHIRSAIGSYRGVVRRLDEHVNRPGLTYIDDYAHHPAEIAAALRSIREIFPGRHITAVFQPHLYTRTRDFAPEFAEALSAADRVVLLDIYPAREEPISGVSAELILKDITCGDKSLVRKEELLDTIGRLRPDVLITFGAGNIDRLVAPIKELLSK
ncbi:MAG: UDP-N-acetylmuramate--L-alanine ligase [Bacteroidales bacterium]|nr:UDP-N-acetylmuramate--L-alanine ligase [Bacteroidales bacterium]